MRQPWLKFFASDWLGEAALRVCSLAARGLWIDLLMLMHQSPRRGYLLGPNGAPFGHEQLARLVGASVDELVGLLDEFRAAGVFSEGAGAIYSRRMAREVAKAEKCSGRQAGQWKPGARADRRDYPDWSVRGERDLYRRGQRSRQR